MKVKTILVPVDLDELATRTLEIVPRLLAGKDRSVLLQHVIDADSLRVASELYEVAAEDMITLKPADKVCRDIDHDRLVAVMRRHGRCR